MTIYLLPFTDTTAESHVPLLSGSRQTQRPSFSEESATKNTAVKKASVYVDQMSVEEYPWYFPDHNPYKRWLEDEFVIPLKYLTGKTSITVTIDPQPWGGPESPDTVTWNEFGYQIYVRT